MSLSDLDKKLLFGVFIFAVLGVLAFKLPTGERDDVIGAFILAAGIITNQVYGAIKSGTKDS